MRPLCLTAVLLLLTGAFATAALAAPQGTDMVAVGAVVVENATPATYLYPAPTATKDKTGTVGATSEKAVRFEFADVGAGIVSHSQFAQDLPGMWTATVSTTLATTSTTVATAPDPPGTIHSVTTSTLGAVTTASTPSAFTTGPVEVVVPDPVVGVVATYIPSGVANSPPKEVLGTVASMMTTKKVAQDTAISTPETVAS